MTCFEMQKTSVSSLSRDQASAVLLAAVKGPAHSRLPPGTKRDAAPLRVTRHSHETQSRAGVAQMQMGLRVAVAFFSGTPDYTSLRSIKYRKGKSRELVCIKPQNGSKPFLDLGHRHVFPQGIVLNLILGNLPHSKIFGLQIGEVEARHG